MQANDQHGKKGSCSPGRNTVIIFFGVSGCGKSLAMNSLVDHVLMNRDQYNKFSRVHTVEGDSFHPSCNIEKMKRGEPLTDQDRIPWLQSIHDHIFCNLLNNKDSSNDDSGILVVAAVSALKKMYRQALFVGGKNNNQSKDLDCDFWFVHLKGSFSLIHSRVVQRSTTGQHFMPVKLLESQFEALEEEEENTREDEMDERSGYRVMVSPPIRQSMILFAE